MKPVHKTKPEPRTTRDSKVVLNHNISVENLEPVSSFLGMYGDPTKGGLDKKTFLKRQELYRQAEVQSMRDAGGFISKSWQIYGCTNFINDASGSLCEICDPDDPMDPVIEALKSDTLILYILPDELYEEELKIRAHTHPKPLFYNPLFIKPKLDKKPDEGTGITPIDFARPLFPELLNFRKPRYQAIADKCGFTILATELFPQHRHTGSGPDPLGFLDKVYESVTAQSHKSKTAASNLDRYLEICERRYRNRNHD